MIRWTLFRPHPGALRLLACKRGHTSAFRSKKWNELAGSDGEPIDTANIVCNNAVQENCLVFRGPSAKAQRGLPDPANVTGSDPAFEHAVRGEYTMQKAAKMLEVLPMVGHWMWIKVFNSGRGQRS